MLGRSFLTAVLAASLWLAAISCTTSTAPAVADAPEGAIVVETRNDSFVPEEIRVPAAEHVEIFVVNRDPYAHSFTIEALEVDRYVGPESTLLVKVLVPARIERLELSCLVTGHEDMRGALVVTS